MHIKITGRLVGAAHTFYVLKGSLLDSVCSVMRSHAADTVCAHVSVSVVDRKIMCVHGSEGVHVCSWATACLCMCACVIKSLLSQHTSKALV